MAGCAGALWSAPADGASAPWSARADGAWAALSAGSGPSFLKMSAAETQKSGTAGTRYRYVYSCAAVGSTITTTAETHSNAPPRYGGEALADPPARRGG